jgi:hypothetical protein
MTLKRQMKTMNNRGTKLHALYAKYYSPTEHLAADEITLLFNDTKSHFQTT